MKKKAKKELKIELADQSNVNELEPYVDKIVSVLGHSEALVTDESYVSDFLDIFDKTQWAKQIKKAEKKLGIKIDAMEYVYEAAIRLKEKDING